MCRILDLKYFFRMASIRLPGTLLIYELLHYDTELYVTGFMCYQDAPPETRISTIMTRPHHPKMAPYYFVCVVQCRTDTGGFADETDVCKARRIRWSSG